MAQRRSWMRAQVCEVRHLGSWLRLRSAARLLAPRRGCGSSLTLLIALALTALALLAATLVLSVLALSVLGLTVLALCVPAAAFFTRRKISRRRLLVLADDDFGAVG